jgi:septum formation protein
MPPQFCLASKSPRRQELLRQMGFVFDVRNAEIVEQPQPGETPSEYARRMALEKARAAQHRLGLILPVLGADTDVVLDGCILGKPQDRDDALRMLARLSNREHEVYSAVAMIHGERAEVALSVTRVCFGEITLQAAMSYWATGEPADKAGAYGIQGIGAQFVREIQGSYSGVVGLPLYETCQLLARFGILPA